MKTTPATTRRARRSTAGFTLVEILISLGIFLIGMTAIVSLFPAAAIIQRETTQEVIADMAAQSARSIINANQLVYEPPGSSENGDIDAYHPGSTSTRTDVVPLQEVMNNTVLNSFLNRFPATVRSYPTGLVDTRTGVSDFDRIKACDMHWVPFLQDIKGDPSGKSFIIRLFIVQHDSRGNYPQGNANDANPDDPINFPKVRRVVVDSISTNTISGDTFDLNTNIELEPGDVVMDNNGNSYTAIDVNEVGNGIVNQVTVPYTIPQTPGPITALWYTPRGGASNSPAQRVIAVEVNLGQED